MVPYGIGIGVQAVFNGYCLPGVWLHEMIVIKSIRHSLVNIISQFIDVNIFTFLRELRAHFILFGCFESELSFFRDSF